MATTLYENEADRDLHSRAIRKLAADLNIPESEIQILYETMLRNFKEKARITEYLVVLVSRNLKDIIKRRLSRQP